jgi:hypothetical protein
MRTIVTAALQWQYLQMELILWIHLVFAHLLQKQSEELHASSHTASAVA